MRRSLALSRIALLVAVGAPAALLAGPAPADDPGRTIAIDVQPGDPGNRVASASRGSISVAILSDAEFDATSVDARSVRFGPGAAAPAGGRARRRDVDRDGRKDLVLRFRVRDAGIRAGDAVARLAGRTRDGAAVAGEDEVSLPETGPGAADPSLVLEFAGTDVAADGGNGLDADATTASFDGAVPGAVAARVLAGAGDGSLGDFDPASDTMLATDAPPAVDGAFRFRSIRIREGVTVRITGALPARLLSLRSALVEGTIDASGAAGAPGEVTGGTPDLPSAEGGAGGPGAGAGGSSFGGESVTEPGGAGRDGGGRGGSGGGQAGSSEGTWGFGGGGGGGGLRTPGDPGQAGNYPSFPEWNAEGGAAGGTGGVEPTSAATADGALFHLLGVGGAGGGAGGNSTRGAGGREVRNGAAAGGGGGGGLLLASAGDVTVTGAILARGGDGGGVAGDSFAGAAGGGGSGGTVAIYAGGRVDVSGARIDASGGAGGVFASGWQGSGGGGGSGRIRIESADGTLAGTAAVLPDYTSGTFRPAAGDTDPPSVFTSGWFAMGPRATRVLPWRASDFADTIPEGTSAVYEIQMAGEDAGSPGRPDAAGAGAWHVVKDAAGVLRDPTAALNLRGYRYLRVRITFSLDAGRTAADPLPSVRRLRIPLAE